MLKNVTGLPVLGTINFLEARAERSLFRREPVLVGAAFAGLLLAYLLSVAFAATDDPAAADSIELTGTP